MKISIVGYMGSGKTTVGTELAKQLNLPMVDLDRYIESKYKTSIAELFSTLGEIKFRKIEHEALNELKNGKHDFVLAVGGGTPVYYNNMELLKDNSFTVYLQLNPNQLVKRLEGELHLRPLLAHLTKDELPTYIAKHLFERRAYYEQADLVISAADKSNKEIVHEIIAHLPPRP